MTRLATSGARIEPPRRDEGELERVLCDLGLAQVLAEATVHELYWKFGEIIGQWSKERERLEVSPVAKALLSMANNLSEVSRLVAGLETGIRSDLEIAVASRVANLLSIDPTVGSQSKAQELLQGKFDVRSPALFAAGHILGATNLPHRMISETTLAPYPKDRLVVVYCAGPHCNGANRAAVRLAELGRPGKEMIGGITGWQDEGFELAHI